MTKPVLMAVADNPHDLDRIQHELTKRYRDDYAIVGEESPAAALQRLAALQAEGAQVIMLLAAQAMSAMTGIDFLERAHEFYPHAPRVLLIPFGNRSASKPILKAMSVGRIDRFATLPNRTPDERFHVLITELLNNWQRYQHEQNILVTLVGGRWDARAYEVRDLLQRSGLPFRFYEADSAQGQAMLVQVDKPEGPFPVWIRYDGLTLTNPTNEEIAVALGVRHSVETGVFDLVIVGSGPAGLSAAVYGGSEGLRTIVVDRNTIGGQAGTSAMIRNYMGFPFGISGAELTNRALDQAWAFGVETSMLRQAVDLRAEDEHCILSFSNGTQIITRAVVLAMGAAYKRLEIPSLEALIGAGVFYGGGITEAQAMEGQQVYVIGAGNSAGQAAVHLAKYAAQVTMIVRGSDLASSMSDYLVQDIKNSDNIRVRYRTAVIDGGGAGRLEKLVLQDIGSDKMETVEASALFVLIGAQPHTDWLPTTILRDPQGFILTDDDLPHAGMTRQPLVLETSLPGVFAAGDVRHGSVKRVASAVGEGGVAIQSVHRYLAQLRSRD
jgi:thioredoxin reductase (NADPH)